MVKTRSAKNAPHAASPPPQSRAATTRTGRRKRSSTAAKARKLSVTASKLLESSETSKTSKLSELSTSSESSGLSEPSQEPTVVFVLSKKPTKGPPYPRSPRSDKCRANETLTTRKQVLRWLWFEETDAILWFDEQTVYCRFCKQEVKLCQRNVYDAQHWTNHWKRHHRPLSQERKEPVLTQVKRTPVKQCRSKLQAKQRYKSQKGETSSMPGLSSDDSDGMAIDSDNIPLPDTPQLPPAVQQSESHLNVKQHPVTSLENFASFRSTSPADQSRRIVTPEIRLMSPTPPRKLDESHWPSEDSMGQHPRPCSVQLHPAQNPERDLSPILHTLTGPSVQHDFIAEREWPDEEHKTPPPTLPYGSPESPRLNELADFAEMSPRARSMSASVHSDSGDSETEVELALS